MMDVIIHVTVMMLSMENTDVTPNVLDTWTCQRAADFIRTQPTHVVILWNVPSQHLHPLLVRPHPQGNPTPTQQFNHSTLNQTQHTLNNQPHSPNVPVNTRVNSTSKDNSGMMVVTSHASVKTVCLVFTDVTKGVQPSRLHLQNAHWFLIQRIHSVVRFQSALPLETTILLPLWSFKEEKPLPALLCDPSTPHNLHPSILIMEDSLVVQFTPLPDQPQLPLPQF